MKDVWVRGYPVRKSFRLQLNWINLLITSSSYWAKILKFAFYKQCKRIKNLKRRFYQFVLQCLNEARTKRDILEILF